MKSSSTHSRTSRSCADQLCQKLFQDASIQPEVLRTARVESIINAIQIGEGISLFPESNFHLFQHDDVVAVPLADVPKLRIGIAYKKDWEPSPILSIFSAFFKKFL